jgi:hypothetical protein
MASSKKDVEGSFMAEQDPELNAETEMDDEAFTDTIVFDEAKLATDNVGGASVQLDVESLVAEFEAEAADGVDSDGRVRRKLEAVLERKRRHEELVDFEDYEI